MSVSLEDLRDLSLARMVAQRLVVPLASPVDVVAHLGCVQGQDLPGALSSIALRTSNRSLDEVVADATPPDDCVAAWAGTYLAGHGPASLADLVRWTGLTRTACRVGIAGAPRLEQVEVSGDVLHHARGLVEQLAGRRADAERLVLLPGFDELVLGYADRSCTVRPEHAAAIVPGNNGMFKATVVDGGQVVGTWRRPTRAGALPAVDWFSPPTTS